VEALRGVSLSVRDGEFVSVVGPSGCGKSSLLKLVMGLERPTRGDIAISGTTIDGPSKHAGCVFQAPVLLPWRTILDNVLLPIDVMKLDRQSVTARAMDLLKLVGLGGFERRYPFELSGGMQQRASIVRALVHDPQLLVMDEPFAALDALNREQMAVELQRINMESGKTIVFITHSISEAVFLSDRIIVMSARPGRVVATFENPFPRPRSFVDLASPELGQLAADIRQSLDQASVS
jgi:NitT/TauT family transport system ATP-binding protein